MARKTLHFRNASAYRKFVAFEHMHGLATKKKNKPAVVIAGKPHKVKHMASESIILTWNVPNWITVGLMGATFFAVVGLAMKIWQKRKGASA